MSHLLKGERRNAATARADLSVELKHCKVAALATCIPNEGQ